MIKKNVYFVDQVKLRKKVKDDPSSAIYVWLAINNFKAKIDRKDS